MLLYLRDFLLLETFRWKHVFATKKTFLCGINLNTQRSGESHKSHASVRGACLGVSSIDQFFKNIIRTIFRETKA